MADVFMFFNRERLPIAVFLANTHEEAVKLFSKLYRKSWERCVAEDGTYIAKENSVPASEWERIGKVFKKPKFELPPHRGLSNSALEQYLVAQVARSYLVKGKIND